MSQVYTAEDVRVYEHLRGEMEATTHGQLFQAREMSDDPPGLLHLENAYFDPLPFDREKFEWLKSEIILPLIIKPEAYEGLVESMATVLDTGEVHDHLTRGGGSLAWATNHISYADIAVLMAARAEVNVRAGHKTPNETHVAIASRLVSIFRLDMLREDGEPGYVVEDGLLFLGGYLQVVPASASGSRLRAISGHDINAPARVAYDRLLNRRLEFMLAPSGTQDKVDGTKLVMDAASRGTVKMLTEPNETRGAERLMTVPLFVDCNPFVEGEFKAAVDATHYALEPRMLYGEQDVTDMMEGIAAAGTVHKRTGTLPIEYRRRKPVERLGDIGSGMSVYKD
jgi:hypothetical protein